MTITQVMLRQMVRDRLGDPADDAFITDPVLNTNINLAITVFDSEHRWPWNEARGEVTFPAGETEQPLPDDWGALRAVTHKHEVLEALPDYEMDRYNDGSGSWPRYHQVRDKTLRIAPPYSSEFTVTIYYQRVPLLLVGDDDSPRCPDHHIMAIVAKAAQLCAVREGDRTEGNDHLAEYLTAVERAKMELNRNMTRGVGRRIRPGSWV